MSSKEAKAHRELCKSGLKFQVQEVMPYLRYYNERTRGRHIFLRSLDCFMQAEFGGRRKGEAMLDRDGTHHSFKLPDLGTFDRFQCTHSTPNFDVRESIFLTLGPRNAKSPAHAGHIVVPPAITEEELQPGNYRADDPSRRRPKLLFLQVSTQTTSRTSELRKQLVKGLQQHIDRADEHGDLARSRLDLVVMGEVRRVALSQAETVARLQNATFCPSPPGDLPFTKRFFLALLAGCIPVVYEFPGKGWWAEGYPSVEEAYPWPELEASAHRLQELVFAVPVSEVGRTAELLAAVSESEIQQKRTAIAAVRNSFVFDFQGTAPDAFSMILSSVVRHANSTSAH